MRTILGSVAGSQPRLNYGDGGRKLHTTNRAIGFSQAHIESHDAVSGLRVGELLGLKWEDENHRSPAGFLDPGEEALNLFH